MDAAAAFFAAWVSPERYSVDAVQALAQAFADERGCADADVAEILVLLSAEKFRSDGLLRELERSQALLRRAVGVISDVFGALGNQAGDVLDEFAGVERLPSSPSGCATTATNAGSKAE